MADSSAPPASMALGPLLVVPADVRAELVQARHEQRQPGYVLVTGDSGDHLVEDRAEMVGGADVAGRAVCGVPVAGRWVVRYSEVLGVLCVECAQVADVQMRRRVVVDRLVDILDELEVLERNEAELVNISTTATGTTEAAWSRRELDELDAAWRVVYLNAWARAEEWAAQIRSLDLADDAPVTRWAATELAGFAVLARSRFARERDAFARAVLGELAATLVSAPVAHASETLAPTENDARRWWLRGRFTVIGARRACLVQANAVARSDADARTAQTAYGEGAHAAVSIGEWTAVGPTIVRWSAQRHSLVDATGTGASVRLARSDANPIDTVWGLRVAQVLRCWPPGPTRWDVPLLVGLWLTSIGHRAEPVDAHAACALSLAGMVGVFEGVRLADATMAPVRRRSRAAAPRT